MTLTVELLHFINPIIQYSSVLCHPVTLEWKAKPGCDENQKVGLWPSICLLYFHWSHYPPSVESYTTNWISIQRAKREHQKISRSRWATNWWCGARHRSCPRMADRRIEQYLRVSKPIRVYRSIPKVILFQFWCCQFLREWHHDYRTEPPRRLAPRSSAAFICCQRTTVLGSGNYVGDIFF